LPLLLRLASRQNIGFPAGTINMQHHATDVNKGFAESSSGCYFSDWNYVAVESRATSQQQRPLGRKQ